MKNIVATLLLVGAVLAAPAQTNAVPPEPTTGSSNSPQSKTTVELEPSQLNAIKIEPVETGLFPVEKEAVGSVSFDVDLPIIQAESTLIGAAATFELTRKELARVETLGETNGIAQKELEQAASDEQTAEAALKAARDAVRALGKTDTEIDQMVAAGKIEPSLRSTKWAVANVPESESPMIQVGQPVEVEVMAFPDHVFEGKVSEIYATVDPNTHRVTVRSKIADPENELRPGMLASVVIQVQSPVESIAIPANGVVREGDGTMTAWVTTDRHHFVQRVIEIGLREDGRVQILKGLQRGELVVTDGAIFLDNMLQAPTDD